jgi:hypothetical protein
MKTKVRNYILICFILIFISSCYKEDRVNPSPRSSTTTNPPIQTPTNNPTDNLPELAVTSLLSSRTEGVDSNSNNYNTKLKLNLNINFNRGGSVYITIHVISNGLLNNSYINNNSTYKKKHDSPLIPIPSNLKLEYSIDLLADSFLLTNETQSINQFYLTLTNEKGDILKTTYYDSYNYSSQKIDKFRLGENSYSVYFEKPILDNKIRINSLSFNFISTIDLNQNAYIQTPTEIELNLSYNFIKQKKFYAEISYLSSNEYITYAETEIFEATNSNIYNSNNTLSLVLKNKNPIDLSTKRSLNFKLTLFDANTNSTLGSYSLGYSPINIESDADDARLPIITNLNLVSNEDYNKNGYSSTYNLNFDLNTTDNLPEDYYITISYNTYGNSYYSGNFISETIKGATSISLLLNAGELLIKNYYDLEIKLFSSNNVLLKTYTKIDFTSLGLVKFEKISQDI